MTLAEGSEPLILSDGTRIDPADGSVIPDEAEILVEVPNYLDTQREIVVRRQRLSDLPVPPAQMHTISAILCYSLLGVINDDIADATMLTVEQVGTIKMSDAYDEVKSAFIENIIKSDQDNVRALFTSHSEYAARKMFALMDSDSEATKMVAAKDILDRAGQRPVDVVEHRHKHEGGLKIIHIRKDENQIPAIDVTPEEM